MSLNRATSIDIHRNPNGLARFWSASFRQDRPMNKNVATLLGISDAQLPNFRSVVPRHMEQSMITDLSTHLGIAAESDRGRC